MTSQAYTNALSPLAYALPLFHAAKHTSHTVLGIFLGSIDESSREVIIQDAIPLLHHYTSLSPMAEAGLTLIQEEAKRRGLRLVGVYVAHESGETGLGRVGERILDGLKVGFEGVLGFSVNDEKLGKGEVPYVVYNASTPSRPLPTTSSGLPESVKLQREDVVKGVLDLIRSDKAHQSVSDFDDHLEDSSEDWISNDRAKKAINTRYT